MKIGFIGTGGTGKTSTIKQLGDLGLPLLESVSRAVFKEWGWKEEDQRKATPELVWKFQKTIFDRKLIQEEGLETSRSPPSVELLRPGAAGRGRKFQVSM